MCRSNIPPRTMRQVSRQRRGGPLYRLCLGLRIGVLSIGPSPRAELAAPQTTKFPVEPLVKPRNWRFQTKPHFKKVQGPLVDVFHEAEEVLIVIDLSGFRPGDVSLSMTPQKYVVTARRGREEYREEIRLPPEVDLHRCAEQFRNGVLEIVLPRRPGFGETRSAP